LRKITIEDVAKAAGVSRALVSIAYRGVAGVSESTRDHIFEVGKRLGYVPNLNAARLASKDIRTVGVFLQDLHNEVFADVFDGIRQVIDETEIQIVLAVGSSAPGHDSKALDTLIAARVGVIIAAGLTMADSDLKRYAKRTKIVSVTRKLEGVSSVVADDYAGAMLATKHLLAMGHTRIAFLANPQTDGYLDRQRGYLDAMSGAGVAPIVQPSSYVRMEAEVDAATLLKAEKPTAVFAHNDLSALGVLDAVLSAGLRPGADVAVVGYDNTSLSQTPVLALTTVDPHSHDLGREAAKLALELLGADVSPKTVVLEPQLIVRASSTKSLETKSGRPEGRPLI